LLRYFCLLSADSRTEDEKANDFTERRTSKFFNRALPDPPSTPSSTDNTSAQMGTGLEEPNNLYELIPQSMPEDDVRSAVETSNVGETYEDIDNCLERTEACTASGSANDSLSSHRSSTSRSSSIQHAVQNPPDDEYLEPVIPPEEEIRSASKWCPSPVPRSSLSTATDITVSLMNFTYRIYSRISRQFFSEF